MTHISRRNERINDANEHHLSKWKCVSTAKITKFISPQKEVPSHPKSHCPVIATHTPHN